jgi:hypothetical protein
MREDGCGDNFGKIKIILNTAPRRRMKSRLIPPCVRRSKAELDRLLKPGSRVLR